MVITKMLPVVEIGRKCFYSFPPLQLNVKLNLAQTFLGFICCDNFCCAARNARFHCKLSMTKLAFILQFIISSVFGTTVFNILSMDRIHNVDGQNAFGMVKPEGDPLTFHTISGCSHSDS